jgi:hypothetical protein
MTPTPPTRPSVITSLYAWATDAALLCGIAAIGFCIGFILGQALLW